MADSLFGLTPEEARQNRFERTARIYGSTPLGTAIGVQGGQAAGDLISGLLGVEDPQIAQARKMQQVKQKVLARTSIDQDDFIDVLREESARAGVAMPQAAVEQARKLRTEALRESKLELDIDQKRAEQAKRLEEEARRSAMSMPDRVQARMRSAINKSDIDILSRAADSVDPSLSEVDYESQLWKAFGDTKKEQGRMEALISNAPVVTSTPTDPVTGLPIPGAPSTRQKILPREVLEWYGGAASGSLGRGMIIDMAKRAGFGPPMQAPIPGIQSAAPQTGLQQSGQLQAAPSQQAGDTVREFAPGQDDLIPTTRGRVALNSDLSKRYSLEAVAQDANLNNGKVVFSLPPGQTPASIARDQGSQPQAVLAQQPEVRKVRGEAQEMIRNFNELARLFEENGAAYPTLAFKVANAVRDATQSESASFVGDAAKLFGVLIKYTGKYAGDANEKVVLDKAMSIITETRMRAIQKEGMGVPTGNDYLLVSAITGSPFDPSSEMLGPVAFFDSASNYLERLYNQVKDRAYSAALNNVELTGPHKWYRLASRRQEAAGIIEQLRPGMTGDLQSAGGPVNSKMAAKAIGDELGIDLTSNDAEMLMGVGKFAPRAESGTMQLLRNQTEQATRAVGSIRRTLRGKTFRQEPSAGTKGKNPELATGNVRGRSGLSRDDEARLRRAVEASEALDRR